jgi:hypothetical protein
MGQHGRGNVADSGIQAEVNELLSPTDGNPPKAKDICDALAQLLKKAQCEGDTAKIQRIKKTQKYYGCRGSRKVE